MKKVLLSLLFVLGLTLPLAAQSGEKITDQGFEKEEVHTMIREAEVLRWEQDHAPDTAARVITQVDTLRWTLSVATNLLYISALIPNISLEFPLGKYWSIGINWHYTWLFRNSKHLYWQTYGGTVAVRRYFSMKVDDLFCGHHLGLYGQMLTYDFEFGGRGEQAANWQYGGGIEYGYDFMIGRNLRIDLFLGFGYMGGRYERYDPEYGYYVWKETINRHWIGPTMAGVSLVWLLRK